MPTRFYTFKFNILKIKEEMNIIKKYKLAIINKVGLANGYKPPNLLFIKFNTNGFPPKMSLALRQKT